MKVENMYLHIHEVVLLGINIALVCKVSQSVMSKVLNEFPKDATGPTSL
jgi:hypothetical protein